MITLFVCLNCDREAERVHTDGAAGRAWFKDLKERFAGEDILVKTTNCLGGCEYRVPEGANNGCCSIGMAADGKFGFVLQHLVPGDDDWKLEEFVRRYKAHPQGMLGCADDVELRGHVATRLPPLKG